MSWLIRENRHLLAVLLDNPPTCSDGTKFHDLDANDYDYCDIRTHSEGIYFLNIYYKCNKLFSIAILKVEYSTILFALKKKTIRHANAL